LKNSFILSKLPYVIIPLLSVISSYFLYKIIPINNFSEISIVSATASIQVWIWLSYVVLVGLIYLGLAKSKNISILNFTLMYILTLVISINLSATAMSLKGTPLASGDIRGDLLGMVDFAQYAKENGWTGDLRASGDFYPPVWPTIVGNIARILDVNAIQIYKPAELVLLIIGPLATFFIWKKLTPVWVALTISINLAALQHHYFFYWKFIPLYVLIPILILLIKKASIEVADKRSELFDHIYGFVVGMLILTYFGNYWWAILFMMTLSFLTFFSKNREIVQKRQTIYYLGAGLALVPPTVGSILEISISFLYATFIILIVLNYIIEKKPKIAIFKNYFISAIIVALYLLAFLFFRTNDDWFEGDVATANPTLRSPFSIGGLDLLFILSFIVLFVISLRVTWLKDISIVLIGFCISALIMRYFIASRMQVTNLVDLWPRSNDLFLYAFNLIILLTVLGAIQSIFYFASSNNVFKDIFGEKNNLFYISVIALFIIYGSLSNVLGDRVYGSMPVNSFNGAWFAHKGCSNPHEDPMLAKVFETRPYIQDFLRENCWGKKWPLVAPIVEN
jgi:hypothetical protein